VSAEIILGAGNFTLGGGPDLSPAGTAGNITSGGF